MRYPAYPAYREVPDGPIGKVPAHWQIKRLRFVTRGIEQGWSPQCDNEPAEPGQWGVMKVGCVNSHRFDANENKALPPELEPLPEYELHPGDVLVSRANTRELVGSAAVVPARVRSKLLLCDKLFRIRPEPELDPEFLTYFLRTPAARFQYERDATGASGSMQNIGQDTIKDLPVPIPSLREQVAIASLLSWKTAQVDALICKKRELAQRLLEERNSLITLAVSGGYGKGAGTRKPGELLVESAPRGWTSRRLRYLTKTVTSGPRGWAQYFADEGSLFLRITNLHRDNIVISSTDLQRVDPPEGAEGERTQTCAGDLLISITADLGSVGVVPQGMELAYVSQHLALVRVEEAVIDPRWAAYTVLSELGKHQLRIAAYGGTKVQLSLGDIKDITISLPPQRHMQTVILAQLESQLEKVEAMLAAASNAVRKLQEYRTALITAAVTGQIDVREVAVPVPA